MANARGSCNDREETERRELEEEARCNYSILFIFLPSGWRTKRALLSFLFLSSNRLFRSQRRATPLPSLGLRNERKKKKRRKHVSICRLDVGDVGHGTVQTAVSASGRRRCPAQAVFRPRGLPRARDQAQVRPIGPAPRALPKQTGVGQRFQLGHLSKGELIERERQRNSM